MSKNDIYTALQDTKINKNINMLPYPIKTYGKTVASDLTGNKFCNWSLQVEVSNTTVMLKS